MTASGPSDHKYISSVLGGMKSWSQEQNSASTKAEGTSYAYSDGGYFHILKRGFSRFFRWLRKDNNWKWAATVVIVSGIIHILVVLGIPGFAPKSAWSRLKDFPLNTLQQIPRLDEKAAPIAMLSPDIRYAFCRYDISKGPLFIKTKVPNDLFSISFYDRIGQNFYTLFGSDLQRGTLNLILANKNSLSEAEEKVAESSEDVVVVQAEQNQGVVIMSAPVNGPAYEKSTEELLKQASCKTRE